jgi:hypothetical protein
MDNLLIELTASFLMRGASVKFSHCNLTLGINSYFPVPPFSTSQVMPFRIFYTPYYIGTNTYVNTFCMRCRSHGPARILI